MHWYNVVSRIILILTVITLALAVPVLVQEKRQSCADEVHVPEEVITVLEKRTREQDLDMLWDGLRYYEHVWGNRNPAAVHLHGPFPQPEIPPPPNPEDLHPEVHAPPPNPAGVQVPEVHAPPQNPGDPDREEMELDDDAPPGSPEHGHSDSPPTSPEGSTKSGDWYTAPPSLVSSTESDSDMERWSTISNAPSTESQSENLKAADTEMRGKAKVLPDTSGSSDGDD